MQRPIRQCYIPNILDLGLVLVYKKKFKGFPYIYLCKTCDPQGGANFDPKGHNLNELGRGPLENAIRHEKKNRRFGFQENTLILHNLLNASYELHNQ